MLSAFDRVYVIHLPNEERRATMLAELRRLGISNAQFVHAHRPWNDLLISNMRRNGPAELGVNLSHIKAIVHALADGAERPLFLEDDVVFEGAERLKPAMADLPENWDVLYLGGHPRSPVEAVSPRLVKVATFSIAEAYSLQRRALLAFYDFWLDRIGQKNAMFDFILGEFAAEHNGYAVYPVITRQTLNKSQISGRTETKDNLILRGWQANLSSDGRPVAAVL